MNKDGICILGSKPIDPKQRIIIFKHRDETQKYRENSKEVTFFSDVLCLGPILRPRLCVSRPCVLNACLDLLNKYTSRKTLFKFKS